MLLKNPTFYSPWLFPIYKYDPNINSLQKNNFQGIISLLAIFFFWLWSIAVIIWVKPVSLGICIGCLVEMIAMLYFVYLTTESTNLLTEALSREDLVIKAAKKSWLQARNSYLKSKCVTKIGNLVGFSEYVKEVQVLRSFIEKAKANVKQRNVQKINPDPESLKKNVETQDLKELYSQLDIKIKAENDAFEDEVRLLIHFELLVVLSVGQARVKTLK